ncbi:hypothetical protein OsI_07745 [Oryza sativa Indica Group]|uniref:Uncharacterized protein n=1 Tax=Oryza sativa subsp. indica TaxID=39946 RepID=B8AEA1_ORYSI|nr:hypothetical protein OsI_07745 [Oryza sativa Indica Group]
MAHRAKASAQARPSCRCCSQEQGLHPRWRPTLGTSTPAPLLLDLEDSLLVVSFGDFAGCSINNIEQNINTLQKSHLASPINCGGSEERKTVTALPLTWSNDKLREDRLRRRLVVTHIRMRADETTSCLE